MLFSEKKEALLWLAGPVIHLLLCRSDWDGQNEMGQAHTLRLDGADSLWYMEKDRIPEVIQDLCCRYGLQNYEVSLILGGPGLSLKPARLPSRHYKEARFMAAWDNYVEEEACQQAFDVAYMGRSPEGDSHDWMTASYPSEIALQLLEAFRENGTKVEMMDAVPAAAGRLFPHICGNVLIRDGNGAHLCQLKYGVPCGYMWLSAADLGEAPALSRLREQSECKDDLAVLAFDDSKGQEPWQEIPAPAPLYRKKIEDWDLPYPAAVLTTLLGSERHEI